MHKIIALVLVMHSVVLAGCGDDSQRESCALDCGAPIVLTLRGTPGGGVPQATIAGATGNCIPAANEANTTVCSVGAYAGAFDLTISAPHYKSIGVAVSVPRETGPCTCGYTMQQLERTLEEAP